jgi:hypothetical protein
MVQEGTLQELRALLRSRIKTAEVQLLDAWHSAEMYVQTVGETIVVMVTVPQALAAGEPLMGVRLKNANGDIVAIHTEAIEREGETEDLLYRIEYEITAA